jgi:RHS repeat-associated protein
MSPHLSPDNLYYYAYDGDGRLCATLNANGTETQYVYDALGMRVAKGTSNTGDFNCNGPDGNGFTPTNNYIYGDGAEQMAEYDGNANLLHENVLLGSTALATFTQSTTAWTYSFNDWLGTRRVQVAANGSSNLTEFTSGPYGDGLSVASENASASEDHFTGKDRDVETGNDYFGARYYESVMGRWMSPDYSMNGVILELPQSWNKYNYELNRPTYGTDPDGRCPWCVGAIVGGVVEGGFDLGKQLYNHGGNFSQVSWGEVGANALGGAVAGAVAVGTGGLSLIGSSVADGIIGNTVGNVVGGVVTRAADPNTPGSDVLSAGEVSQDAVSGFVGGTVGTLAGEVVHVPDEPIRPDPRHQARTSVYNARMATRNKAIIQQSIRSGAYGSAATHGTNGASGLMNGLWNWLMFSPPPPPPPSQPTVTTSECDTLPDGSQRCY